jgi:hypothetical protein
MDPEYPGFAYGKGDSAATGFAQRLVIDFIPNAFVGPQPIGVRVRSTTPTTAMVSAVSATAAMNLLDRLAIISRRRYSPWQ